MLHRIAHGCYYDEHSMTHVYRYIGQVKDNTSFMIKYHVDIDSPIMTGFRLKFVTLMMSRLIFKVN